MKKSLLTLTFVILSIIANAQCTTNNATGCQCKTPGQTDCDLLPDIQLGHPPFYDYDVNFGVKEYSQSGNADTADDGKLYVTVSTPNTGHGPLELYTVDTFVCNTDTFYGTAPSICPDLITYPKIFMNQRIYHKSGNTMTSWSRFAGTMTYHPGHNHMHVDNWGNYTLRTRDTLEPNPLNWPLLGIGTKLAFCVEDYGTCPGYPGHCLDTSGTVPLNNSSDFPNYGLGGGGYSCSAVTQGISSGYVDIYWTTLPGMYVELPPGLCNGDYYIVCEVDPNHNFLEENETNNSYAAPIRLTKQLLNPAMEALGVNIANSKTVLCQGESVSLAVQMNFPNASYHWSNGDTTQFTTVNSSGVYTVDITNQCGTGPSLPVTITVYNQPSSPVGIDDTIPVPGVASLFAASPYPVKWFDQASGGALVGTGNSFTTPFLNTTAFYYAEAEETHAGTAFTSGLADSVSGGQGSYSSSFNSLIFNCYNRFTLHAVTVYSATNNNALVIQLLDSNSNVLNSVTVSVTTGTNIVVLDFPITPGIGLQLTRTSGSLFRNNPGTNVGYPFTVPNFCSITGSTQGSGYYYFFYNWDIRLPDNTCSSARTPVEAHITLPNSIADVSVIRSLKLFPNPAKDHVYLSFQSEEKKVLVELNNSLGQVLLSKNLFSKGGSFEETINTGSLSKGVYFIHILSSGKNYYQQLIVE